MSILKVVDFEKSFDNNVILSNVNLNVEAGEVISIIGPSGVGKSTLLRGINYLEPPTNGQIFFENEEISHENIDRIRSKMGMVFQDFGLFSHLNVMENIIVGPIKILRKSKGEAREKAGSILQSVGLSNRSHFYPRGRFSDLS